jgi:hypothetical protein
MLDLYANPIHGIRCLMLQIYHDAAYVPPFPLEDYGCMDEPCAP